VLSSCLLAVASAASARASDEASAGDLPLRLTFESPRDCPGREAFLAELHARGRRTREARPAERTAAMHIEIVASPHGPASGKMTFRPLEGPLEGRELVRELRGADCASAVAGLAFVASVVLDPEAALTEDAASSTPAAADPSASARGTPSTSVVARDAPARGARPTIRSGAPAHLSLGGAIDVASGVGPDPTFVARLFVDLDFPAPLPWASARLSFGRGIARSIDTAAGRAQITLTDVRLEPCAALRGSTWSVGACGLVEAGVLEGNGAAAGGGMSGSRALAEVGVGVRPSWTVSGSVVLSAMAGGATPLMRYRFYFSSPDTTVYQLPAWSAFGELSLGVRFR
jgi:hypothetical protein